MCAVKMQNLLERLSLRRRRNGITTAATSLFEKREREGGERRETQRDGEKMGKIDRIREKQKKKDTYR